MLKNMCYSNITKVKIISLQKILYIYGTVQCTVYSAMLKATDYKIIKRNIISVIQKYNLLVRNKHISVTKAVLRIRI